MREWQLDFITVDNKGFPLECVLCKIWQTVPGSLVLYYKCLPPPPSCVDRKYPSGLPATSVVIIFHNEAYTVLLRTITSVVNRTPPELLHEIVLVDDYSDHGEGRGARHFGLVGEGRRRRNVLSSHWYVFK